MKKILSITLVLIVFLVTNTSAQLLQEIEGAGEIDWSVQVIKCTGIGGVNPDVPESARRAGAIRAATLDALRNILETVKGVYIDAQTTVENAITASDVIYSRVEGVCKAFKIVDTRYMSDGSVEVDVEMSIRGVLADIFLPQETGGGTALTAEGIKGKVFTGLVVNATGLEVQPAMSPKIINEDSVEVYGTGFVSREYAIEQGVVGYAKDVASAKKEDRVTDKPAVIKGIAATGPNKTDVVISNKDAMLLHSMSENLSFMDKCRVIIVVD